MRHALALTGRERPRVLHVPTATGDADAGVVAFYERCAGLGELSHLKFHPWPPAGLRELALSQDAISVGGGNTANMLAIWRVHGFDAILREAWAAGVVLFGASAGMICWFEAGVTDSFGPGLDGLRGGLGLLAGSACPHYDGEELRRPRYRELVDGGFPEGIAADDGVGLHYVGTELREVVTSRPGAAA
jgi:peptidase E